MFDTNADDRQATDQTTTRRGLLRTAGTTAAALTGVGVMTGTASARARTNAEVRRRVALDFKVWNGEEPISALNRIYYPPLHKHNTIFTGPSFDGLIPGVKGLRRPGYKMMVRAMRRAITPLPENDGKIIFPGDLDVQRQNPRSRGPWYIEGRINGKYVYEEGRGVHTWAGGKVTEAEAYDFNFGRLLDQADVPHPF